MAHEEVYGFCENKCKVPVAPKTETDAVEERVTALEESITIDSNGTIIGNVKGNVKGRVYLSNIELVIDESGEFLLNKAITTQSLNVPHGAAGSNGLTTSTIIVDGYKNFTFPLKVAPNIWVESGDDIPGLASVLGEADTTRPYTFSASTGSNGNVSATVTLYVNGSVFKQFKPYDMETLSTSGTLPVGASCYIHCTRYGTANLTISGEHPALSINAL